MSDGISAVTSTSVMDSTSSSDSASSRPEQSQQPTVPQLATASAVSTILENMHKTEELQKILEKYQIFESQDELEHRAEILEKLNTLLKQWIQDVAKAKKMRKNAAKKLDVKVYTFGSCALGTHHKGADLDALCVVPKKIRRKDYCTSFFELLKQQREVTGCRLIATAYVPLIKMNFDGIETDLLFVRLPLREIPNDLDLQNDNVLSLMDDNSCRSLSGYRNTHKILAIVPNIEIFRLTLRFITLWAKNHGIYSNILGYLGGVNWTILVARTHQLYPNATATTLVHKFFLTFSRWKWPSPVFLECPENDRYPRVCFPDDHLMPIVTPAYPQRNSSSYVTESTKKIILNELNRGLTITEQIILGHATWKHLLEAPSFFYMFDQFIVLLVSSQTADEHAEWCGLVESRIRDFTSSVQDNQHISLAQVNPKCFDFKAESGMPSGSDNKDENKESTNEAAGNSISLKCNSSMWFIGLAFERTENLTVDLSNNLEKFKSILISAATDKDMLRDGMHIEARHIKNEQLSSYVDPDFLKRERESTDSYNNLYDRITANRNRISPDLSTNNKAQPA